VLLGAGWLRTWGRVSFEHGALVKILSTTVGETAVDFRADNVGLGLTVTSLIMATLLALVPVVQFRTRRYVPVVYWLAILFTFALGTSAGGLSVSAPTGPGVRRCRSSAMLAGIRDRATTPRTINSTWVATNGIPPRK
jgi:uncharacterized membrane-anchored protein